MGYLEIIVLGYTVNIVLLVLIMLLSILITLFNIFFGDAKSTILSSMVLEKMTAQYRQLEKIVPNNVYKTGSDYALFLPFMSVVPTLEFLIIAAKYGLTGYLVIKIQTKLDKMTNWLEEQE